MSIIVTCLQEMAVSKCCVFSQERDADLECEERRQEENDQLRKQFAQAANAFHSWLTETRSVRHVQLHLMFYSCLGLPQYLPQ